MENIVGIFRSLDTAVQVADDLVGRSIPEGAITLLSREQPRRGRVQKAPEAELDKLRTSKAGSVGAGKATGEVLGTAIGGSAGFALGATAAALAIPGLGVIFGIGLGAGALLGLGGAAAGAKLGDSIEDGVDPGASKEQVELYHQLLRRGDSLVIANVRSGSEIATVREVFRQHGSEDVETVRKELGRAA